MPHTDPQLAGMIERAETLLADLRRMTPKAREKLAGEEISEREIELLCNALRATARPASAIGPGMPGDGSPVGDAPAQPRSSSAKARQRAI